MNSEGIKTFIMLSKLKNFTRTAERLYVAQSTVTNRILELENETGKKLFVRKQGGVELTDEGALFLSYALRIDELEETFIQEVNASARFKEKLRVGTINAVYESDLYPVLSGFYRTHPGVALKITLGAFAGSVAHAAGRDHRRCLFLSAAQKGGVCVQKVFFGQAGLACTAG